MSQTLQKLTCEAKDCTNELGYFDLKHKSRFCHQCKRKNKVYEWKCRGCDKMLSNSQYRETKYWCDDCNRGRK